MDQDTKFGIPEATEITAKKLIVVDFSDGPMVRGLFSHFSGGRTVFLFSSFVLVRLSRGSNRGLTSATLNEPGKMI